MNLRDLKEYIDLLCEEFPETLEYPIMLAHDEMRKGNTNVVEEEFETMTLDRDYKMYIVF